MANSSKKKKRPWTDSEDERLAAAIQSSGERNWKAKAAFVGTRDHVQCLQRWANVLKPRLTQGIWTHDQDLKLAALVAHSREQGLQPNWARIARKLKKGSARACRERWQFTLRHAAAQRPAAERLYHRPSSLLHSPPPRHAHDPNQAAEPNRHLHFSSTQYAPPLADFFASGTHLPRYTEPRPPPSASFFRPPSSHMLTEPTPEVHWRPLDSQHLAPPQRSPESPTTSSYPWHAPPSHAQLPSRHP